ncbi:Hsp20/alpha crystallin family protein [Sediminitomix flava]|uniref:HSP20 family protein n=1 Tax=Sediminitomix flava TaxID=379075 RepID=A0A315ZA82_SEDFL|nr:Hsp20/alpha crystallin family protein [Sediminitomix flava]PWJ41114.1 HSP20 family protein [Sediminitomix flava]
MYTSTIPTFIDEIFNTGKKYVSNPFPAVNIKESETGFTLEIAAPGLEKEDFNIKVEENTLQVSTEKKEEADVKFYRKEFSYDAFKRSFKLPRNVDTEQISASYINGILTLELPKKEEMKARKVEVQVD